MEVVNPVLSFAIRHWMTKHGKVGAALEGVRSPDTAFPAPQLVGCPPAAPLLQAVKPKLSEEQKANMRTCFRMMDADGGGTIDAEELGAAFKLLGLGVSCREVANVLQEVDRNGSGARMLGGVGGHICMP